MSISEKAGRGAGALPEAGPAPVPGDGGELRQARGLPLFAVPVPAPAARDFMMRYMGA